MSKKIQELTDSYEEAIRLVEELELMSDCHNDEICIEIIGEAIEATKENIRQIVAEIDEKYNKIKLFN